MKEIINLAKSLSDDQLETLIGKLKSHLDRKKEKELQKSEEDAKKNAIALKLRAQIDAMALENGYSMRQLGFVLDSTDHSAEKDFNTTPRKRILKVENQTFALENGELKIVFTVQAKIHRDAGTALRFDELNEKQQQLANDLFESYIAR